MMRKRSFYLAGFIAVTLLTGLSFPASGKDLDCQFQAKGLSMGFGMLDPSSGVDVIAAVSAFTLDANKAGDCVAAVTMTIVGDNGLHFSGSRRLKNNTGTDFIPYSLVGLPFSSSGPGNKTFLAFTFNGSILGSAYANASAGSYSDTILVSVTP